MKKKSSKSAEEPTVLDLARGKVKFLVANPGPPMFMSTFTLEAILQRRYDPHLLKYPRINERQSWIQSCKGRTKAPPKPTVDVFSWCSPVAAEA